MEHAIHLFGPRYEKDPRALAVGPAARDSDFGAIGSAPVKKGGLTHVDTWAGRGGFGSKLFQEHGLVGIIYGGTHIDEDFRDRSVADQWFQDKFNQRMAAKDMEVTTKYRYDPKFNTGGTFGRPRTWRSPPSTVTTRNSIRAALLGSITPPWMATSWRSITAPSTGVRKRAGTFTNVLS
jgi:aldehyde:ferredoxin oxidoreductase